MLRYYDTAMPQSRNEPAPSGVLVGLATIGGEFHRSRWTVARWIKLHDFPAARLPDGSWFTTPSLIDNWLIERRASDPAVGGGNARA